LVKKKAAEARVVIDYHQLNTLVGIGAYLLLQMEQLIANYLESKYLSEIDLKAACNQIRIKERREYFSAFQTLCGNYEYLLIPFGPCNSPSVFQRMIPWVIFLVLGPEVCVYFDNIFLPS
jgi:hypothetical protein